MPDCSSLPNAAELVDSIHKEIALIHVGKVMGCSVGTELCLIQAADAIEQLLSKTEQLKAERDAAVEDLRSVAPCSKCKHFGEKQMTCDVLEDCLYGEAQAWEWRGVQEIDHFRNVTKMVDEEPCESCSLDALWEQINDMNGGTDGDPT